MLLSGLSETHAREKQLGEMGILDRWTLTSAQARITRVRLQHKSNISRNTVLPDIHTPSENCLCFAIEMTFVHLKLFRFKTALSFLK